MGARAIKPAAATRRVEAGVRRCAGHARVVLAVSGGRDSMALLHAAARVLDRGKALVATFDHATGPAATRAANLVWREASRMGFPVVIGHAGRNAGTEAGWRETRHAFLREVAVSFGGQVMTAHTRDDQVETVLMRVLRGSGARGLAALYAAAGTLRPFLELGRDEVAWYAARAGATWIEDPTNSSATFLRNRVRRDLLPALHRADPGLAGALIETSRKSAELRRRLDEVIGRVAFVEGDRVLVRSSIAARDHEELRLLWPAIAAKSGIAMDWRGTVRAAAFTRKATAGARMPLSGGWVISRARDRFELHRGIESLPATPLTVGLDFQEWRFREAEGLSASDNWFAQLPEGNLRVRAWLPGDRMRSAGMSRRVKRYLSDARISGEQRARWPVVLCEDDIVWIPGVRRSDAAAVRPGRPGLLYRCDCDRR